MKKSIKISQKKNREDWEKAAERIFTLSKKQTFYYNPGEPLKNVKKNYFELADLWVKAQKSRRNIKLRLKIRK